VQSPKRIIENFQAGQKQRPFRYRFGFLPGLPQLFVNTLLYFAQRKLIEKNRD